MGDSMAINTAYEAIGGKNKALSTYKQMSIETATPAELVLMLYNHALRCMKEAMGSLAAKDIQGSNKQLQRAQDIVDELRVSLNFTAGGKIAESLDAMYEYINSRLCEANIKKDPAVVEDAVKVMSEVRDGWAEVVRLHGCRY